MKGVLLFHPKKGFFLSVMTLAQIERWRNRKGFVLASWRNSSPHESDLLAFIHYVSVNILWCSDWSSMMDGFARLHRGSAFKRVLRDISKQLKTGKSFEWALRALLPAQLATALISSQKRGQLIHEVERIVADFRAQAQERNKRRSKQIYPAALGAGLLALIILVDVQFVPVLNSLFDSYGLLRPPIMLVFNLYAQGLFLLIVLILTGISYFIYRRLALKSKARIPIVGELLVTKLHQQLIDAYQESLIRECSYDFVLKERYEAETNASLRFGMSTVSGNLKLGKNLMAALEDIPTVSGWVGGWAAVVLAAPTDRIIQGLSVYQKELSQKEIKTLDSLQNVLSLVLITVVAILIAVLGFLITLPLQYADKLF